VGIKEINPFNIHVFTHRNMVIIQNEQLVSIQKVEIMDMYGRVVWQGDVTGEKTTITLQVAAGLYAVKILTGDNQQITSKVVVNR